MEQDPNIMPTFEPAKALGDLKRYVMRKLCIFPEGSELALSEHNRGAEALLDAHLRQEASDY